MTNAEIGRYDIAIVGAGPVGSVCAIAHARKGYRVALFEANPAASKRLAGEWLHPPAVQVLNELGISVEGEVPSTSGEGFAVFPEDGREPIVLPYADGSRSLVCEHSALVSHLRQVAGNEPGVDLQVTPECALLRTGGSRSSRTAWNTPLSPSASSAPTGGRPSSADRWAWTHKREPVRG